MSESEKDLKAFVPTMIPVNESDTKRDYDRPFTQSDIVTSASIIIPLSLFGLVANLLTILVILRSPRLKSAFNQLLISLCISDFISSAISPVFLYRRTWGFSEWGISNFICKTYWGLELWTSYLTSAHIFLFALFRYISVKSAHDYHKITSSLVKKVTLLVWIITFLIGFVPFFVMFHVKPENRTGDPTARDYKWPACTFDTDWLSRFIRYAFAAYSLLFYIPMLFVLCLAVATVVILLRKRKERQVMIGSLRNPIGVTLESKRRRKERQVMLQLFLIVGSFFIGYVPLTAYHFFTASNIPKTYNERRFDWWFAITEHIFLRVSECLNPIFYNMASKSIRKETLIFIKTCCTMEEQKTKPAFPERASSQAQNIPVANGLASQDDNLDL